MIEGRFDLEVLAGSGGMGQVYRARDRESGQTVAVKVLVRDVDQQRERFLREAQLLDQVRHPAIVRYVAHGVTDGGELFLVIGITLTAVGCSTDRSTMCDAGLITGAASAIGLYLSIDLLRRALPRVHIGQAQASAYAAANTVGLVGQF